MSAADAQQHGAPGADGPTARLVVTRGGVPSDAELAALVVALAPVPAPPVGEAPIPAWRRAALSEGTGGPRVLSPGELGAPVHDRWG